MKITQLEATPVSVPYRHREVSSQVSRDGVTDIVIRLDTDDGLTGWGEACSGADVTSVLAAVQAMRPFVVGADPWEHAAVRDRLFFYGLWQFRAPTACFAFAGIDMAMWDLCGKAAGQPLYRLLGGAVRSSVNYFYYLSRGDDASLHAQCADGLARGYSVFYLKVGVDEAADKRMVRAVRSALGAGPALRLDANGSWSLPQARRMLRALEPFDIDFIEQPVRDYPVESLAELRRASPVPVCANEGLWSVPQAYERIRSRQADVYCFSTYWVGGLASFVQLARVADLEGALVCKHTHGELGIAAAAGHHAMLTLPNVVLGNQQTAAINESDILTEDLPIAAGPDWSLPARPGIGVDIDAEALRRAADRFREHGQFLPYQPDATTRTRA
jgi:L-alanine-DL-glutamate epimerase-like enolase superfamily enzyme